MHGDPKAQSGDPSARAPFRCLVVQLSKLGDTFQSLMALRAAKQLYPEMEITLITRDSTAAAARRVPWIHSVIAFPADTILDPVRRGEKTERQALSEIARWLNPLVQQPWEIAVNWSYSEASSYLTGLLPARIKLGFSRRKDTSFSSVDGWSHYIQSVVQGGIHQNIHLTDILTTQLLTALQIHIGEPEDAGNAPVTSKNFFELELGDREVSVSLTDPGRRWLAIQLGSGNPHKRWGATAWAQFIEKTLTKETDWRIVLLGSESDAQTAVEIREQLIARGLGELYSQRVLSLAGATDFDVWASIISRCQWLFATDTAAIHLASVLGTRVFNISVGPCRFNETGPYGNGHYVVASNEDCEGCAQAQQRSDTEHTCQDAVSANLVYAAWTFARTEWSPTPAKLSMEDYLRAESLDFELSRVRLFRSKIRPGGEGGGVVYEPLLKRPIQLSDWSAMVMGHVARAWYCGWVPQIGAELSREQLSPALLQQLRELKESTLVLSKICAEAITTSMALNQKTQTIKSDRVMGIEDRNELQKHSQKLQHLEALIDRLVVSFPTLGAYSRMAKILMHNLSGEQLVELSRETTECYRQINDGVQQMHDWIEYTFALSRPKAISRVPREVPTL